MTFFINNKDLFFELKENGSKKSIGHTRVTSLLLKHSSLKYLKVFMRTDSYYYYDPSIGIYVYLQPNEFPILVSRVLSLLENDNYVSYLFVSKVVNQLKLSEISHLGCPQFDKNYLAFTNGILDLETRTLKSFSPDYFITSRLPFEYDPQRKPNKFWSFLDNFCNGLDDRKAFTRAWLNALVLQRVHNQVFIYITGPAGTGKSTMGHLATALVGKDAVVTASLRALNSNEFEILNLIGKKLILISDSEEFQGPLDMLKRIVGGDALKGRKKYVQGSFEVMPEGLVLMIANHPLRARDSSNAINRRLRVFPADRVAQERSNLIHFGGNYWEGTLAQELPGIMNWVLEMDQKEADDILQHTNSKVPSLLQHSTEAAENLNPILVWVKEEVLPGRGSYVGFRMQEGPKSNVEGARRMALYPAYYSWCKRVGLCPTNQKRFIVELLETLKLERISCQKEKKEYGVFISGIQLRPDVYNRDHVYGAPLLLETNHLTEDTTKMSLETPLRSLQLDEINRDNIPPYRAPTKGTIHPRISPNLYSEYMEKLGKTSFKEILNKVAKQTDMELAGPLTHEYCSNCTIKSEEFQSRANKVITKGLNQIKSFGGIPYSYKPLGVSPRILPISYGNTINSTKRLVRERVYINMGEAALEHGKVLVDLDIVSCYTSILLGLYPDHLRAIQRAIEGEGLWNYIKKEFQNNGRGHVYNKPAVKVCVYSSFFMGGNRAMINGILDSFRKDLGLSEREFRNTSYYEDCHQVARDIVNEMMNSSVIMDFKAISEWIRKAYDSDFLVGPTGHSYFVSEETFKTAYPNYLQSFEFALLAQTTLETIKSFPSVEVIGHYHDGNVLAIKVSEKDEVLNFMFDRIGQIGSALGLRYKQKLEVKRSYP